MDLVDMAGRWSGPAVHGLNGRTCDYMGNNGCFQRRRPYPGTIRVRIGNFMTNTRLAEVTDGTTQTLLFWESRGDILHRSPKSKGSVEEYGLRSFTYWYGQTPGQTIDSNSLASYKSYVLSWTGFRLGSVNVRQGRTINISNLIGQPSAAHAEGCCVAFTDGAVKFLSRDTDADVMLAIATSRGGEVETLP